LELEFAESQVLIAETLVFLAELQVLNAETLVSLAESHVQIAETLASLAELQVLIAEKQALLAEQHVPFAEPQVPFAEALLQFAETLVFDHLLVAVASGLRLAEIDEFFADWPFVIVAFVTFADSKFLVDSAFVVELLETVGHK
jgi:hypothetical protein